MAKSFKHVGLLCAAIVGLGSSPAAAECIISSAEMFDPFAPYKDAGAIVHKESGFVFPAEAAGFQRQCEMTTDFTGNHFEVGYVRSIGVDEVTVKIVVVHLEELSAQDHYNITKPDLISHYSSASAESEGEYFVSGRTDITAYQGIFDGEKAGVPWHFSLTALDYGYWDARLIADYPQEIDAKAQEVLMELIEAFQWQIPTPQAGN